MSESLRQDEIGRHLANLEDMKTAHAAQMQVWANEDAARAEVRAGWVASFEAGLMHFANVTGLHEHVAPLVAMLRGETEEAAPVVAASDDPPAPPSPNADDTNDSGAVKTGGGAIVF